MKHFIHYALILTAMSGVFASCSSDEPAKEDTDNGRTPNDYAPLALTSRQGMIVNTQTAAAFDIYEAVKTADSQPNMVVSPLSISLYCSMMANGATGSTRAAILSPLGYTESTLDELNDVNALLLNHLPDCDTRATVSIANSIWANPQKLTLNEQFVTSMTATYSVSSHNLVDDGAANSKAINKWAETSTNGLIKEVVNGRMDKNFMMLNATYFKAPWAEKNIKSESLTFTAENGVRKKVSGFALENVRALQADGFTIAQASYGNGAYRLSIIMDESGRLPRVSDVAARWAEWATPVISARLVMPEWEAAYDTDIKDALCSLGMGKAFDSDASFEAISSQKIDNLGMRHVVKMITNKKGSEAAAVTGGEFISPGDGPVEKLQLTVDRPFLYIISEQSTGCILLMGEVTSL